MNYRRRSPELKAGKSEVKHHLFPNHFVMREKSWELLGPRLGVCAIEWVLAI